HQFDDSFSIAENNDEIAVTGVQNNRPALGESIEILGRFQKKDGRHVVTGAVFRRLAGEALPNPAVLTNLDQVHRLSWNEIRSEHPVDVTGVVVLQQDSWLFVRDASRTIYVTPNWPSHEAPKLGEVFRIEGHTFADAQ